MAVEQAAGPQTLARGQTIEAQRSAVAVVPLPRTGLVAAVVAAVGAGLLLGAVVAAALVVAEVSFIGSEPLIRLIGFDSELNIPTMASALTLATCSVLLLLHGVIRRALGLPFVWRWLALGAIFGLMAVDEGASVHEALNSPLQRVLGDNAEVGNTWVYLGVPAVILLAAAYLPFIRHLPGRYALGVLLAGGMYVTGVIGVEVVGGLEADTAGTETVRYQGLVILEEGLEFAGVGLFLVVLWALLRGLPWRIESDPTAS